MVALRFCIVESPDARSATTAIITESAFINNPNRNNVSLEFYLLIEITIRCLVRKLNHIRS